MISLLCGTEETKKKETNEKKRPLTTENTLAAARGEVGGGGWVKQVMGIKSELVTVSTEQRIELSSHYIAHLKLI